MMKTLSNIFKQDKEKFVIPRSVQQVLSLIHISEPTRP